MATGMPIRKYKEWRWQSRNKRWSG